jgi:hypothetical protein
MATSAELHAYTARRPFEPFWLRLSSGETIHVKEPNRAAVMPAQMVYTGDGRGIRWIPLREVEDHGSLASSGDQSGKDVGPTR